MPTKNPRINLTLEESTIQLLSLLAKQENKTIPSLTRELLIEALEQREDYYLSTLAEERFLKNEKMVSHDEAWK